MLWKGRDKVEKAEKERTGHALGCVLQVAIVKQHEWLLQREESATRQLNEGL